MGISSYAKYENRWYALIIISLGLAIVVIDNTILNVSIPYMISDLGVQLSSLEFVISGYSLTISAVLITVGRLGDLVGRRKVFVAGVIVFMMGSFIGSESTGIFHLLLGRSLIQAVGAAMTLTSALSLIDGTFKGEERAIAFGVWGAIAGASATVGPLLGGYLTSSFSWRWSFRINIFVGMAALAGSVLIVESCGEKEKRFDWVGTLLSSSGLLFLVYGFIEGDNYGWFRPKQEFTFLSYRWPWDAVSVIPFFFALSVLLIRSFIRHESVLEEEGRSPLLELSMFRSRAFSIGLAILAILAFGQSGTFFMLPIFFENVLGLNAFQTGLYFLPASIGILVFGLLSGFISKRVDVKYLVISGLFVLALGTFVLRGAISVGATYIDLFPALSLFGLGFGLGSSQLNNIILSSAPLNVAGEASAISATMRQVGGSIGVAILGAILVGSMFTSAGVRIQSDPRIPDEVKSRVESTLSENGLDSKQLQRLYDSLPVNVSLILEDDIRQGIVEATRTSISYSGFFVLGAAVVSLFLAPIEIRKKM